ncbi:hypothetical protein F5883DRAFT_638574 [Diaporthe sp. PMI_573]|nr:hypothetical protein F5883DRAFT_638574 [Diaporthaceae sp. PMI_573]
MPHRRQPVDVEDDEGYVKDLYLRLDKIRIASLRADSNTSVKALWENGWWRTAARRGLAPFQDAHLEDLQPIFETLIEGGIDDVTSPEYTLAFYPRAHELALHAENALLHQGDKALAAELYLRACAVLRVGRYSPLPASSVDTPSAETEASQTPCPVRARAWHLQKSYHLKAGRLHPSSPLDEVTIPHTHDAATRPDETSTAGVRDRGSIAAAKSSAGPARPQIPLAVRLPPRTLRTGEPCPAVLVVSDDRTAHSGLCADFLARGWGCVVVEAPGFGDCPVPPAAAAESAAALWASVLEWMGAIRVFDMARVVVWAAAAARVDDAPGLVSQFAAAVGGAKVRGCVAVVGGGESAVLAAGGWWGSSNGRVLVVADNDGAGADMTLRAADGLWMPADGAAYDVEDDGLVLFEYGTPGVGAEQAVRSLAAGAAAVYDWVEDLLLLDLEV